MSNLRRALRLFLAVALLVIGLVRLAPRATTAAAAVSQGAGFEATVDGFTSWYGSYHMGTLGVAWCIDHGIRAPDPDLAYVPTSLESVPASTRTALAWAMGRHGVGPDAVGAAALMLVAHDLMGATYPSGRLDVDTLGPEALTGFGGAEADVVARARAVKADSLTHASLRPPWQLDLYSTQPFPASLGVADVTVTAGGVPVAGIEVTFDADPIAVLGPATIATDREGVATFWYDAPSTPFRLSASATVPDLVVQAFASTAAPAQRVARPATVPLSAALDRPKPTGPPSPTTTTTRPPAVTTSTSRPPAATTTSTTRRPTPTTTTRSPRTTTSTARPPAPSTTVRRPTPTTRPPATTTSTTRPQTTTTMTTTPAAPTPSTSRPPDASSTSSTSTAGGPVPAPPTPPPSAPPPLPRTGFDPWSWGATGAGLVMLGSALRARPTRTRRRPV